MSDTRLPAMDSGLKQRVVLAAVEAVLVVGAMWYLNHRDWVFIGSVTGAIVISTLAPPRLSGVVSGVSLLSLAAFFYFHYNWTKLPVVFGVLGLFMLVTGVQRLKSR